MSVVIRISMLSVLLLFVAACGHAAPVEDTLDVAKEKPLLLTPLIESGKIEEARRKALVTALTPNITSYSGFFNVDNDCDSNLFFWFFPSQSKPKEDPVSIWLNGGPGASSMFGLLTENGPYELTPKYQLKLREYSWNRNSSVLYIDNPVGTGFSFTNGPFSCYPNDEPKVARGIVKLLVQFFKMFPELKSNPFYLTGESYAGKYIPSIGYALHTSKTGIRLEGLAIGNGWTDPVNQVRNSDFFYNLGLIDAKEKATLKAMEDKTLEFMFSNQLLYARNQENLSVGKFMQLSGLRNIYNYVLGNGVDTPNIYSFLDRTEIRKALHVGDAVMNDGNIPYESLKYDFMKSVKDWLGVLMDNYRVLLYFGQMDLRVGYAPALEFIKKLNWKGSEEYKRANKRFYKVDGELAGYVKTVGNFTELLIRNAGHMVPTDQPKWSLDMYNKFIFNIKM